jgi:hypothetical protein
VAISLVVAYAKCGVASAKATTRSKRQSFFAALVVLVIAGVLPSGLAAQALDHLKVQVSLGHNATTPAPFYVRLVPSGGVNVDQPDPWRGEAGEGHAASRTFTLDFPATLIEPLQNMHVIWSDLIAHSDADTVRRLAMDPAWRIDPRRVVFELDPEGTSGFSLTIDQLKQNKDFWIPSLDLYISVGDQPLPFAQAQKQLAPYRGARVLDQVEAAPEASYSDFENKWPNMGDPAFAHPVQEGPGHIIGLSWDSAVRKFGIDRGAGVWNDYGNPDHFHFWFEFANLAEGITPYWKSQTIQNGLPFVTTTLERDGVRYEVEQFAYPLNGPPHERGGDLDMLLLQRVRLTELSGQARVVPVTMAQERSLPAEDDPGITEERQNNKLLFEDRAHRSILLAIEAPDASVAYAGVEQQGQKAKRVDVTLSVTLPAGGTREFFVTLPSPAVKPEGRESLAKLEYDQARAQTLDFWSSYLAQGAQFEVPEQAVNDLFRANLWHALTLPRRHNDHQIDLPYSNFAYSQTGTPWPINQAVYVDYMIFGLRGYNQIATDEFRTMYANNQEFDGRVNGYAHWLAYTPGILYAVAQNYLLSNDRASFEKVLPETLKALDWSMAQIRAASSAHDSTAGLVAGPLNDITGPGYWAFNQAYLYAGIAELAKALERYGNPRAAECRQFAQTYLAAVNRGMSKASVQSPLVQLRDHTWVPFVPSNAAFPGRNFEQWYPSDVDTGPTHLLRLRALPVTGTLANSLLNDQEDNLFLHGWGLANEPVYNQQATAYLMRDDVKATIRAFYSLLAGGFSQGAYEPVEHRWRWGQYFGPPSTDGAWFELYRNMLIREVDDHTLLLSQAPPRAWMQDGKEISVKNAPSWFGKVSFIIKSHANDGKIEATVQLQGSQPHTTILLRLRHPQGAPLRSVTVNGKPWQDFDAKEEWLRISDAGQEAYSIVGAY